MMYDDMVTDGDTTAGGEGSPCDCLLLLLDAR
jgi:hypothetical protein